MTELENKFWDAAITEAATNRKPPNQADQILMRLHIPDLGPPKTEPQPKARLFRLRRVVEVSVAAVALIAIGILTGLIPVGGNGDNGDNGGSDGPTPDPESRQVAAAPGTKYELKDERIELMDGWLLVTTGSPEVSCNGSVLNRVDGRVLAHAGSMPTGEQAEAVAGWLEANNLEMGMIKQARHWTRAAGMAALVLIGSAYLDGQLVEAEEQAPSVEPTWFTVSNVMEIEELPESAEWVQAESLDGAHLEFLAEHTAIKGLMFRNARRVTNADIARLKALTGLRLLDLQGAYWQETVNYSSLAELMALQELHVDYVPCGVDITEEKDNFAYDAQIVQTLRTLTMRGVDVRLSRLQDLNDKQLGQLIGYVPKLAELDLSYNTRITPDGVKALADLEALTSLNLTGCPRVEDLGFAYLAKANRLEKLSCGLPLGKPDLYQIAKMTNLQDLRLYGGYLATDEGLEQLKSLEGLEKLCVLHLVPNPRVKETETIGKLVSVAKMFGQLEEFGIETELDADAVRLVLDGLQGLTLKRLKLGLKFRGRYSSDTDEDWKKMRALFSDVKPLKGVERLDLWPSDVRDPSSDLSINFEGLIKCFPDLKRVDLNTYRNRVRETDQLEEWAETLRKAHPGIQVSWNLVRN